MILLGILFIWLAQYEKKQKRSFRFLGFGFLLTGVILYLFKGASLMAIM